MKICRTFTVLLAVLMAAGCALAQQQAKNVCSAIANKTSTFDEIKKLVKSGAFDNEYCTIAEAMNDAAGYGRIDVVKLLQERHVDINSGNGRAKGAPLLAAVCANQVAMVNWLLDHNANPGVVNYMGHGAMNTAARCGSKDVLQALLQRHFNLEERSQDGMTPVMVAAEFDQLEMMQLLLDLGADPLAKDKDGLGLLGVTIRFGQKRCFARLAEKPFDANAVNSSGSSLLHEAVRKRDLEMTRVLLEHGANTEAVDSWGDTPLMSSISDAKLVRLLLDFGAGVNTQNKDHETALFKAINLAKLEAVQLLLERGANPNQKDKWETPLLIKARYCDTPQCVQLLLEHGAKPDVRDQSDQTLLMSTNSRAIARLLIDHGADINAAEATTLVRVLHHVVDGNRLGVLAELIERGADLEVKDWTGQTPLYDAVRHNHTEAARMLAEAGASLDVNSTLYGPMMALHPEDAELHEVLDEASFRQKLFAEINALPAPEQFARCVEAFRTHQKDEALRRRILQLSPKVGEKPPVPDEAKQLFNSATEKIKNATAPGALREPITLLQRATALAPWWANAYYNLSRAQELSSRYEDAIQSLRYYIALTTNEADAREAKAHIVELVNLRDAEPKK